LGFEPSWQRLEEIMNQQGLRSHLVIAALVLGVAFSASAAFAQKGLNDGGAPADPTPTALQSQGKATPIPTNPYYGRNANDGGTGPEPTAAQLKAAQSQGKGSQQASAPHLGRPINDGGTP
jgi:hypothetical protein